jgi:hypothetical protein
MQVSAMSVPDMHIINHSSLAWDFFSLPASELKSA